MKEGFHMAENTLNRDRAFTRRMGWRKALRKRRIVRQYGYDFYDNLHQYSKNKIHCSCAMCKGNTDWGQYTNSEGRLKVTDRRKLEGMREQMKEDPEE